MHQAKLDNAEARNRQQLQMQKIKDNQKQEKLRGEFAQIKQKSLLIVNSGNARA